MSSRINFNKPSDQLLLDLLNYTHGTMLPVGAFTWGQPKALTAPEQLEHLRNTSVEITAHPGSGYEGSTTIYYNRIDLGRLFRNAFKVGVDSNFNNSLEALALINEKYGLAIAPSEIVSINAMDFEVAIEITNSLAYVPGSRIIVAINVDEGLVIDFEEAVDRLWNFTNFTFPPIANQPLDA